MSIPRAIPHNTQMGYALDDPRYGGAPANGSDDSAVFAAVWAHCVSDNAPLVIPPGPAWHLNASLDPAAWHHPVATGAGYEASTVILGAGVTMFQPSQKQYGCRFANFTCQGGKGFYHGLYTSTAVAEMYMFRDMRFYQYTGCCIANESPDNPHLSITGSEFRGNDFLATIGIAWVGQGDAMNIQNNLFSVNRVAIKLSHRPDDATLRGPKNGLIQGNGFIRLGRGASDPSAHDLWIVPGTTSTGGTTGQFAVVGNKFGSENLRDATTNGTNGIANSDGQADHWVLFADEDAIGTDNTNRFPVFTPSAGGVSGLDIDETNNFNTAITNIPQQIVYSTTPWVMGCKIAGSFRGTTVPQYALELSADPAPATSAAALAALRYNQSNIIGPFRSAHAGIDFDGLITSNYHGMGRFVDPIGQYAGKGGTTYQPGGQNPTGYIDLLASRAAAYTLISTTKTSITDSQGGTDAIEVTFSSSGTVRATLAAFTPGQPVFVDFDVQAGQTGTPLTTFNFFVLIPAGAVALQRRVLLPAGWESRRFWFTPRDAGPYTIQFQSSTAGTARFGRVNVYHSREPISHGPIILRQPNGTIRRVTVSDAGALVVT